MAFTLSNLLQALYSDLGQAQVDLATGGSTTTITDTKYTDSDDDAWKDGAAFIVRDAGGASAAPEGEFQRVSAYVASTGVLTVDTAFSSAVASGDKYMLVGSYYPLRQMIQAANDGLRLLGDVDLVDTTTLDTIDGDTEYAAAVAWKRGRPLRIDVQGRTGDSADNQWSPWSNFEYVPAVAGSTGRIIFPEYPFGSRDIRVWYRGPHPVLSAYSDVVAEVFDPETVVAAALVKALEWQNTRSQGADQFLLQRGQKAEQNLANLMVTRPTAKVKRKSKLFITRPRWVEDDDVAVPA